jgi:DNA end-binding protein Ku
MSNYIAQAPEPTRSTGTITLSWGLVNMSLAIYSSTEEVSLGRKEFVGGDPARPAGRAPIDKTTGKIVDQADIKRLSQADNGMWVEVSDDELAGVIGVRNVAEILAFVPEMNALSQYVPDGYYQLRPKQNKNVPDPASNKAFSLLSAVMDQMGVYALVRLALRGPARYGLVTPQGELIFVHSTDEVRWAKPLVRAPLDPKEVEMARNLVEAIGIGTPELPNHTARELIKLVNAKAAGQEPEEAEEPATTKVDDIMSIVQASIAARKGEANEWAAPASADLVKS